MSLLAQGIGSSDKENGVFCGEEKEMSKEYWGNSSFFSLPEKRIFQAFNIGRR